MVRPAHKVQCEANALAIIKLLIDPECLLVEIDGFPWFSLSPAQDGHVIERGGFAFKVLYLSVGFECSAVVLVSLVPLRNLTVHTSPRGLNHGDSSLITQALEYGQRLPQGGNRLISFSLAEMLPAKVV
jgi:hypothetical protein